jgi:hypothetical protein
MKERETSPIIGLASYGLVPMMELYQNNPKDFLKLFPKEVLGSAAKESGYASSKSYYALQRYNFIQYNSRDRINIICVDIDHHKDGAVWLDHDMPQPTWTVWTDRGVQFMWVLENPIFTCSENKYRNKHLTYAKDVLNKIVYALDADTSAIGFNRVFRNPLKHDSRYSDSRVDLKDFNHLESPPSDWLKKTNSQNKSKTLFSTQEPTTLHEVDFGTMKQGDGRNVALFNRLRVWAYHEADMNTFDSIELSRRGFKLNELFAEPMSYKEVDTITNSIDEYIINIYSKGNYMARTTPEERSKIASANGKKGGAVRKAEAYGRIIATITQMQSFDIKITVSEVARRAKCSTHTARNYLTEKGWREVSRKEGWQQ